MERSQEPGLYSRGVLKSKEIFAIFEGEKGFLGAFLAVLEQLNPGC